MKEIGEEGFIGEFIGKGIRRKQWYSICSAHYPFNLSCHNCLTGVYISAIRGKIENVFYRVAPRLWRWWSNR